MKNRSMAIAIVCLGIYFVMEKLMNEAFNEGFELATNAFNGKEEKK